MATSCADSYQWLSINEDSLFLHDGLIKVTDLIELPESECDERGGIDRSSSDSNNDDVNDHIIALDTKNPRELSDRILCICRSENNSYGRLVKYRLNALKGLWNARKKVASEHLEQETTGREEALSLLKKQGGPSATWNPNEQTTPFSSRLSLLLLFPLIQSQSRSDPTLCTTTIALLLQCLRECPPHSLTKEPADCLTGLETLLCAWLSNENAEQSAKEAITGPPEPVSSKDKTENLGETSTSRRVNCLSMHDKEEAASALISLTCARGFMKSFVNTIHMLQSLSTSIDSLPIASTVLKLLELEGGIGCCSSLLGNRHTICWGFEDMLKCRKESADKESRDGDCCRSLASDGSFLYTTNAVGQGLAKFGTGLNGTLRGFVYGKNNDPGPGRIAFGNDLLLFRPQDFDIDKEGANLAVVVDRLTLKVLRKVTLPSSFLQRCAVTTVQFCSDGRYFYWIWCPVSPSDKTAKGQYVYLDVFDVTKDSDESVIVRKRVLLQRKEESCNKSLNETLLSRLRPYRPATTATIVALSGASPSVFAASNQESSGSAGGGTTSCGVPLKVLLRSPIYTCGNFVVILTSSAGSSNNVAARTLFGSSSSLANLRSLATNLCFSVKDGLYVGRYELIDAPTCSLSRGALLQGLGVCYDSVNNFIWACSNDWVDQFYNPGHQAIHHVYQRLGIDGGVVTSPPDSDRFSLEDVIRFLLQHVGSMCCHQMSSDLFHTPPPMNAIFALQQPIDFVLLTKVLDILDVAVRVEDDQIICCILVVFQVIFKAFKGEGDAENIVLKRARMILWKLLSASSTVTLASADLVTKGEPRFGVEEEACRVVCAGLNMLYPGAQERGDLLNQLVIEGERNAVFLRLRDLILMEYTQQLQRIELPSSADMTHLKVDDALIHEFLKIAIRESCCLLHRFVDVDAEEFERLLVSVPLTSACTQYLSALQNQLIREVILLKPSNCEADESTVCIDQKDQLVVIEFAMKVLIGAQDVLEVLLDVCQKIMNDDNDDDDVTSSNNVRDLKLQGLERIAKATILGQLLPVLVTSLTHENLMNLKFADVLLSQLVKLAVLSSRVSLQMKKCFVSGADKRQIKTSGGRSNEELDLSGQENVGFLSGFKVPTPWARGCTVESIHPVRDNYKFKETVHIAGARCLYLRFDPRCSSQYDYDKLIVYTGEDTTSHKIAEYGGNTFGYGSRSVLGSGWPKDLIKVEGDSVTFSFEMRSGREHNTPDKAMWGFMVSVRAQDSNEATTSGLPFVVDLALGLAVLSSNVLQHMYDGPRVSREEEACSIILRSRLMHRCVGLIDDEIAKMPLLTTAIDENLEFSAPHQANVAYNQNSCLSIEILHKLRLLSGCVAPQLRPSIRSVLHADVLEAKVISAVVSLMRLPSSCASLAAFQDGEDENWKSLLAILNKSYQKLDALTRRLQALAEHEQRWQSEMEDIRQGMMPANMAFFVDYHFSDSKTKELSMLCFLKGINAEGLNAEAIVYALKEKLEAEAYSKEPIVGQTFVKTRQLVETIFERTEVLLLVTLDTGLLSDVVQPLGSPSELSKPSYSRSLSAPSQMELQFERPSSLIHSDSPSVQRKRLSWGRYSTSILDDSHSCDDTVNPQKPNSHSLNLVDQVFTIISSQPETHVTCCDFVSAVAVRCTRGNSRKRALFYVKEMLSAALKVDGATHLVTIVSSVLHSGPRVEELTCTGMADEVREAFAENVTLVVRLAAQYPLACCNSIGLLCVVPYTRWEEQCLVQSGLVQLLDKLCSLCNCQSQSGRASDSQAANRKMATMAWASFQVLANCCVSWEEDEEAAIDCNKLGQSGLAQQVATLLTNHLARATDNGANDAASNEALQEVLFLLNNLSRSQMGREILSQPTCVSKLLSLLLDQRPSPKLVLVILQLCRTALPLMSAEGCIKVSLPSWSDQSDGFAASRADDVPAQIASLLLAKLGDYVIPGLQTTALAGGLNLESVSTSTGNRQENSVSSVAPVATDQDKLCSDETDSQDGRLSVYLYKREDQPLNDIIQPLLGTESRLFRNVSSSSNVDRLERISRDLTTSGRAEVCTEDAMSALRRAGKWAQNGMVVSTGPAVEKDLTETHSDRKKITFEMICKDRNTELAKCDPVRVFISGQVANSMASEVIALLHGLLTATTAKIWASAVERVLGDALSCLPNLLRQLETIGSQRCNLSALLHMCRQVVAALCALGGFKTTLKPGCEVLVFGAGNSSCVGSVVDICERRGLATVQIYNCEHGCDVVSVPLSRLSPRQNESLPVQRLSQTDQVVVALHSLFVADDNSRFPIQTPLPVVGEGNSLPMAICRIVAEIRTRASMVMAQNMKDPSFAFAFMQHSGQDVYALKHLAKECLPGDRLSLTELHCGNLRMLYRDCAKPPPPPNKNSNKSKEITWNTTKVFPPVRASLFSHGLTGITFLGDPRAGSGLPRGAFVYASQPIPQHSPSFYWELEVCSLGDPPEDMGPVLSFGFAPNAERKDSAWANPVGSILFHNNGRAAHYNGSSLLQWKSIRLDVSLATGDVAGCGWERTSETPEVANQQAKGTVFFTHNGCRLSSTLDDVLGGMWPVVHIQKKNTRIKANFGARPFLFVDGQHHMNLAHEASESTEEISANFSMLPFPGCSDSESDISERATMSSSTEGRDARSPPSVPFRSVPFVSSHDKSKDYSLHWLLQLSYSNMTTTGPDGLSASLTSQDSESDADDANDDQQHEDHYALLVKAWESRVFPVIRRRFRNEAERRDGLEQIRGALQLGMTDIARQTVEYLYEENGGIPRDLHLPTIEDIKDEAAHFSIERIRKGMNVVIRCQGGSASASSSASATTVIPKFAVHNMLRTFGLTGVVLDVDTQHELVQIETYLRSEGVLVRYWYPLDIVERPHQGLRKTAVTGSQIIDTNSLAIHRELLRLEESLVKMYCRDALLKLIELCNSPDFPVLNSTGSNTAVAASADVFQELDVENLQLLSNSFLAPPSQNGAVLDCSLTRCRSPNDAFAANSCLASDLFYGDDSPLRSELASAIGRAASLGEDYLMELTSQMASCLQLAPENFLYDHIPVTDFKVIMYLQFLGAAFLFVGCKSDTKAAKKDSSQQSRAAPWARIYCYNGQEVKKSGLPEHQEVVAYPRNVSSAIGFSSATSDDYPPTLLACNRLCVKVGGGSCAPGAVVAIHAIPAAFPLAVAYIEELLSIWWKEETTDQQIRLETTAASANVSTGNLVSSAVLLQAVELLTSYLNRTNVPFRLKECLFHLLAELLRSLHHQSDELCAESPYFRSSGHMTSSLALFLQLHSEVLKLYEEETKTWSSISTSSGMGIGLGAGDYGRFSSYFQSLLEVSLAVADATSPFPPAVGTAMLTRLPSAQSVGSGAGTVSSSSSPVAPPSPSASSKRKKLKAKRDRDRVLPKSRSGSSSPRSSLSEAELPGPSGVGSCVTTTLPLSSSSGVKAEDMLWFHRALTMSEILRFLVFGRQQGASVTHDAIADACQSLVASTAHMRLLIVNGLPIRHSADTLKQAIVRSLQSVGGVYHGDIFVPRKEDSVEPSMSSNQRATANNSRCLLGFAVIQLRSKAKIELARKSLFASKTLMDSGIPEITSMSDDMSEISDGNMSIATVNQTLQLSDTEDNRALDLYLKSKIFTDSDSGELLDDAINALTDIFHSCFIADQHLSTETCGEESGFICLSKEQIMNQATGNLMLTFVTSARTSKSSLVDYVSSVLVQFGFCKRNDKECHSREEILVGKQRLKKSAFKKMSKAKLALTYAEEKLDESEKKNCQDEKDSCDSTEKDDNCCEKGLTSSGKYYLTLDGFVKYVSEKAKNSTRAIWQAFFACGFDLHLDRCSCTDASQALNMSKLWTLEMDCALVQYVNALCRHLALTPSRLHPHEIYLSPVEMTSADYSCLQGVPTESIRLRFALLQSLNSTMETFLLPMIDLRAADKYPLSMAALLAKAKGMIFYDTKVTFMNRVLNAMALRKSDQAAPEISLDPLETIGTAEAQKISNTKFFLAMQKLRNVSSSQFCVQLASGGDPMYAFNVRLVGEEVHGTSGSFRHFLSQVSRELQGPLLPLLMLCPSAAANRNKGKYVLQPGSLSFTEEKMLEFFGQLLGITIRADIPLPIDLVSTFWKCLLGLKLDPMLDLQDVDVLTFNYIKEFNTVENTDDFSQLLEEHHNPHFVYSSLTGEKVELCSDGANVAVTWKNRLDYVSAIRDLRMKELESAERYLAIRGGLSSIVPCQILHLLTPSDLELRTCGFPEINLDFLKAHTMYQVGLMESDAHVRFFWNTLEGFTQDELRKFVKFASNQDRIPCVCPCRDGQSDAVHVPPYPMKIAPPEGKPGSPDSRYVRVETCMFMVKLPQYSTQEIMTERLLYAINCREDPLSG